MGYMMKLTLLLCSITLFEIVTCDTNDHYELELVQVLFRHGERTPQKDETQLIINASRPVQEPWGYSQLTKTGRQQEYKLGQFLHQNYRQFLGIYRPEHVYAYSSPYDRTKASLALVLASLYPPEDKLNWNENLNWQPIPIHFLPRELDMLFNSYWCSKFQQNYQDLMKTKEMQALVLEYEDVFRFLSNIYPEIHFDLRQIFFMNNILDILHSLEIEMPSWYSSKLHEKIRRGALFYLETLSHTPEVNKLNGGNLAKKFIENMDVDGLKQNPRKIYLYSGHEFTMYAVAKAHNITLQESPPSGSAFAFEKLRDDSGRLFVRMYYISDKPEKILMKLNGHEYCPVKVYMDILSSTLPNDDESRCLYENLRMEDFERILNTDSYTISQ